jgi:hypothetical protein
MVAVCRSSRRVRLVPGSCQLFPYYTVRTLPLWFTRPQGRRGRCALGMTLAHRVRQPTVDGGYREERLGWKVVSGLLPQKVPYTEVITETFRTGFSVHVFSNLISAPPNRAAPLAAAVLLAANVEFNLLNIVHTISLEGNSRKRSYIHSHANRKITETTSPRRGVGTTEVREL